MSRPTSFEARNPATGERLAEYPALDEPEIARRLERAEAAFATWRLTPAAERARALREAARRHRSDAAEHARRMTEEMGKPIRQAEAEVEKCAWVCEFYAEHGEAIIAPEPIATDATRSYVRQDPLGPVLAVMPWNFPFWQVFRFAAPALAAGNVGLLKHASNVPGCALAIERILGEAGAPEGVFQTLLVPAGRAEALIDEPAVRAVTLTGSEPAGMAIAARAGRNLKKTVLELGGSDPFVVLDDVDVAAVAARAAWGRAQNSGQSCIAAKRFIVAEAVADAFVEAFRAELAALRVGDPLDPDTDVGPLARADLVDELHDQVERSVAAGGKLRLGGERMGGPGCFYPPTLLEVAPGDPVAREETFGPVAAVLRCRDDDEAVALANQTEFGLGASVWSGDPARAEQLVPRIEAGAVFVNEVGKSEPRLPFGGIKRSGYGRELAHLGLREFTNAKTVWVGS